MYIPPHFRNADPAEAEAFIKRYPFGILVSSGQHRPEITHLPFVFEKTLEGAVLTTHLAGANSHLSALETGESTAVFSAPHAYISPSLYARDENVPTWNYIAVHCAGQVKLITALSEKIRVLEKTIAAFEPAYAAQWTALPEKYKRGLLEELTAAELHVTDIQACSKLSQNKNAEERRNIAEHLSGGDAPAADLAAYMRRRESACGKSGEADG